MYLIIDCIAADGGERINLIVYTFIPESDAKVRKCFYIRIRDQLNY